VRALTSTDEIEAIYNESVFATFIPYCSYTGKFHFLGFAKVPGGAG
jgi:hypothetical protein